MEAYTFPTSFMQHDIAPIALGVCIFVVCQLVLGMLVALFHQPHPTSLSPKETEAVLASNANKVKGSDARRPPAFVSEPDVEPGSQQDLAGAGLVRKRCTAFWWVAAAFLALLSWIAGDCVWHSVFIVYNNAVPPEVAEVSDVFQLESDDALAGRMPTSLEALIAEDSDKNALAVRGDPPPRCVSGKPALNVKLTRMSMDSEQTSNYVKCAYYGTIVVGTPGLAMTVLFDTGSGHLMLPSMYCKSKACRVHTRYRRSGSVSGRDINFNGSSVQKGAPRDSITVEFGTGEATGVIVEDMICMGPMSNATVTPELWPETGLPKGCMVMHFLAATDLSEDPFMNFGFDGVMGLSLMGLSQTPKHNFLHAVSEMLAPTESCAAKSFGVFLASNPHEGSDIAFGGWNEGHLAEELSWAPVHNPDMGHWIVGLKGIRVDNDRLDFCDDGKCKAAVDTGTALLSVPPLVFRELFEHLRHEAGLAGHCQGPGPMLHFEFEDFTVTLGPKEYASLRTPRVSQLKQPELASQGGRQTRADLRCFPLLMTLELEEPMGPKLFIMGEPVLRKYYTVYDPEAKRVGFGRAKHSRNPTRDEIFLKAPEVISASATRKDASRPHTRYRSIPTMFDVFRWRNALRRPSPVI